MFDGVVGQESTVTVLREMVAQGKLYSAYCLTGPSGVGKTTVGRILARAILCEVPVHGNPCGKCPSCESFLQDQHFGFRELDAASFGGKEEMVKLRDDAMFESLSKKKIILIDECHDISKAGQDALLKQIEECPEHLIYIFCTTDPDKLKKTLRSRCREFQFSRVTADEVVKRLNFVCDAEGYTSESVALQEIARRTQGHVRDAISLLQEVAFLGCVNLENLNRVSVCYDDEICRLVISLGNDLPTALQICESLCSRLATFEFYTLLVAMVSDAAKLIYGYEEFVPARLQCLRRIKDIHGATVLEFLSYLLQRDKYVEKVGVASDLIILHYKYASKGFEPTVQPARLVQAVIEDKNEPSDKSTSSQLSFADLQKMSPKDRAKVLRDLRVGTHKEGEDEPQKVPDQWPLPKDERLGTNSFDEKELSPLEFSRKMVGGRGGNSI